VAINKATLTEALLKEANIPVNHSSLRIYIRKFWVNYRLNKEGSLRMTTEGFVFAKQYMKFHNIALTSTCDPTSKNVIRLDRLFKGPYYLEPKRIHLASTKEAIELVLYNGDLNAYLTAQSQLSRQAMRHAWHLSEYRE
jgi:hypothetical protein